MTDVTVIESTTAYERWQSQHVRVVPEDLDRKHRLMRRDALTFMRATYYRFVERFPEICPELVQAPAVGAVGDLHVENFGTWRDAEGRLVWGINDLDEADRLPYALDLARLSASALLAAEAGRLDLGRTVVADAILSGYLRALEDGVVPVVLAERRRWLVNAFTPLMHEPREFWQQVADLPDAGRRLRPAARAALELAKPGRGWKYRLHRRTAGAGSLGRPRVVAVGDWEGGLVARELKGLPPPATRRPGGLGRGPRPPRRHYGDPWAAEHGGWVVRRLSPDNAKLELARIDRRRADRRLLTAMGREAAQHHLRSRSARDAIAADAAARPKGWLAAAAEAIVRDVRADYEVWRKQ